MKLSINLKTIREKWKYNQHQIEALLNLNRGSISSYETGKAEPKIITLVRLYEITNIDLYRLIVHEISNDEIPAKPYESIEQHPAKEEELLTDEQIAEEVRILTEQVAEISARLDNLGQTQKE